MKISHRLLALSGFSAAGLACVAGVSFFAVTSIQTDLQSLTLQAAPLQSKTYELQERTERAMGRLLKLSLARDKTEAEQARSALEADLQAIDQLRQALKALDPKGRGEAVDFRASQGEIVRAVDKRLADNAAYRQETENARAALLKAEEAVGATRSAVKQIGVEAGKTADAAQDASRRLANTMKIVLSAQSRLKEVAIIVSEVDTTSNRFRLNPLKDKLKSAVDGITRLATEAGSDDSLKEVRALAATLPDAFAKEGTGLLALRANVLATKPDAAEAYAKQRKAILEPLEVQGNKLNAILDTTEVQAAKQRQTLEAALRLRNEPGGVVVTSEEVSLALRDTVGNLRLLMLAATDKEAEAAHASLKAGAKQLTENMTTMRAGLLKMGRPSLAVQVDGAIAAMATVGGSIDKVAAAKRSLLASETLMTASMDKLKETAQQQANLGEAQVKSMAARQTEVTATVDARVQSSLTIILGMALGIIAVSAVISWRTVRSVTQRLDEAVRVAEEVSQGHLLAVPVVSGNDETARLMSALGRMVGTLTGIVGNIQQAATQIHVGSGEISRGNEDLSSRTEQQASQLQQTAASVEELTATVRQNADSARSANVLAAEASTVAARGGELVSGVVATMSDIEQSSKQIGEIVGVIDGIAFQTNILALNAAVEAARAGEHGRGFAVVASEVRALAKKSAEAARQVKTIVDASVGKIETGSGQVRHAGTTMQGIVEQVQRVTQLIAEIARASEEQAESIGLVGAAVSQLDNLTQQNAALAEQGTAAASSLRDQAGGLQQAVAAFRLQGQAG
ncbi:MAG: methyl-accepting chemotaxis protein [Aquabacterium sp.]|nr:methyl-accepting chemotaxis protein [Aquabacterium sp.]